MSAPSHYSPMMAAVHDFFYATAEATYTTVTDAYDVISDWTTRRRGAPILSEEWINEALDSDSGSLLIVISKEVPWRLKALDAFFPGVSDAVEPIRGISPTPTQVGTYRGTPIFWVDLLAQEVAKNIKGIVICTAGRYPSSSDVPVIRFTAYGVSLRPHRDTKMLTSGREYDPEAGLSPHTYYQLPQITPTSFPESLWGGHLLKSYIIPNNTHQDIVGLFTTPQVEEELKTLVKFGWLGSLPHTAPVYAILFPDQYEDILAVASAFRYQEGILDPRYSTLFLVNPPEEDFYELQKAIEGAVLVHLDQPTVNPLAYKGTDLSNCRCIVSSREFPITSVPPLLVPTEVLQKVGLL